MTHEWMFLDRRVGVKIACVLWMYPEATDQQPTGLKTDHAAETSWLPPSGGSGRLVSVPCRI